MTLGVYGLLITFIENSLAMIQWNWDLLPFTESKKPLVLSDLIDNSGFSDYCSGFSASFIRNIGQFRAKTYFKDHRTANTIQFLFL